MTAHSGALAIRAGQLGVPKGQKIPAAELAAKPGDSTRTKRRKSLAKTLKKMH